MFRKSSVSPISICVLLGSPTAIASTPAICVLLRRPRAHQQRRILWRRIRGALRHRAANGCVWGVTDKLRFILFG
jgi:hypothetical protein